MSSSKKAPNIRRLGTSDARAYKAVLIEALIVHPDCFFEDYNVELSRPISEIESELKESGCFGAWLGEELVGIAACVTCSGSKRQHCGQIRILYVKEKSRHSGIAGHLLEEILHYAASILNQLEVEVSVRDDDVVRLFERYGFRMCGLLPRRLRVVGEELDVWAMVRSVQ